MPRKTKRYNPYIYPYADYRVKDGDTIDVTIGISRLEDHPSIEDHDLGFKLSVDPSDHLCSLALKMAMRLSGIDTPEKNTEAGRLVAEYVHKWLAHNVGWRVCSIKLDKFSGRFIGIPLRPGTEIDDIAPQVEKQPDGALPRRLWELGMAKAYNGRKKEPWSEAQLEYARESAAIAIKEF